MEGRNTISYTVETPFGDSSHCYKNFFSGQTLILEFSLNAVRLRNRCEALKLKELEFQGTHERNHVTGGVQTIGRSHFINRNIGLKLLVCSVILSAASKLLQNIVFIILCYLGLLTFLYVLFTGSKRVDLNSLSLMSEVVKLPRKKCAVPLSWLLKHCSKSVFLHTDLISHMSPVPQYYVTVQCLENQ